jgi:hypothetical protein
MAKRSVIPFREAMMNEANCPGSGEYIIKVKGHLDDERSYWFEGLRIENGLDEDGRPISTLSGPLVDQAALHGVLAKIRDMNLPLISVSQDVRDSNDEQLSG